MRFLINILPIILCLIIEIPSVTLLIIEIFIIFFNQKEFNSPFFQLTTLQIIIVCLIKLLNKIYLFLFLEFNRIYS